MSHTWYRHITTWHLYIMKLSNSKKARKRTKKQYQYTSNCTKTILKNIEKS